LDKSTTIPGLNRESAYSKRILLPPLDEQNRIVEKLKNYSAK
jgi:restriction endonuclease S subunit